MSSIDYDKLRADAEEQVAAELAEISDPFERRSLAEEIRDQAHMELSLLADERKQLIAAAALYEPQDLLYQRFGISRLQMRRLAMDVLLGGLGDREGWVLPPRYPANRQEAARDAGVPYPDDVVEKAAKIAARYETAEARRDAAVAHLEDAYEAVRTAGGRFHVSPLERPDFTVIRQAARKEVEKEFNALDVSDEERLRRAAEAVDQEEERIAELLPQRDAAACSLAFYTTARGVYFSAGISRTAFKRVLARALKLPRDAEPPKRADQPAAARAARVKFIKNADRELPGIAKEHEAAKARQAAAIEIRDAAIRTMAGAGYGWTPPQIAEVIDRDPKVVRRVLDPEQNS
ncbi:hypothetical protein ACPCSC_30750 [Streptomyces lavendulocolor]|uniref:hypothetical protein n=1 Tax=Streptomyces lavendulocolor TaxID=67316 RepID=UPI003C305E47